HRTAAANRQIGPNLRRTPPQVPKATMYDGWEGQVREILTAYPATVPKARHTIAGGAGARHERPNPRNKSPLLPALKGRHKITRLPLTSETPHHKCQRPRCMTAGRGRFVRF